MRQTSFNTVCGMAMVKGQHNHSMVELYYELIRKKKEKKVFITPYSLILEAMITGELANLWTQDNLLKILEISRNK